MKLAHRSSSPPVVLIVEDEALIRMNTEDVCEDAGYKVLEAPNADEALSLLEVRPDVRLVMTDIDMPGSMDGLALAHHVRRSSPQMCLVIASGKAFPSEQELPTGAVFFSKPFQERHLIEVFASLLGRESAT